MNRKVIIQQPTYTISDANNDKYVSAWTTYKTCWATMRHITSQEVFESGQMVAKDVYDWFMWRKDIPAVKMDMRISYNGEYYYLVSIREPVDTNIIELQTVKRDNGT